MAITYSIDEKQGRVYSEYSEILDWNDFHSHYNGLRSDVTFRPDYPGLCDWRQLKEITVDYRGMYNIVSDCPWGAQSYWAIVVSKVFMFGMSRMFQNMLDKIHGTVQIFYDIHDAEAWLDSVNMETGLR